MIGRICAAVAAVAVVGVGAVVVVRRRSAKPVVVEAPKPLTPIEHLEACREAQEKARVAYAEAKASEAAARDRYKAVDIASPLWPAAADEHRVAMKATNAAFDVYYSALKATNRALDVVYGCGTKFAPGSVPGPVAA